MSNRDDDGYNSPEGKEISDEVQRRKAALAQLTVDGGDEVFRSPGSLFEVVSAENKLLRCPLPFSV